MYHSGKNPLRKVTYKSDGVTIVKSDQQRRLHKAFLRYHDPKAGRCCARRWSGWGAPT